LWPALYRLAQELGPEALTAIKQEHTETGAHRNVTTPFPQWIPPDVKEAARHLSESEARAQLGPWLAAPKTKAPRRRR
jgi:hypothetical protein